jgi:hypothetical protein
MKVVGASLILLGLLGAAGVAARTASMIGGWYAGVAADPMGTTLDDPDAERDRVLGTLVWGVAPIGMLGVGSVLWKLGRMGPRPGNGPFGRL